MTPSNASPQARFFRVYVLSALILMMLMLAVSATRAQDTPPHYDAFFIAPADGPDQVWGLVLADFRTDLITHDLLGVANYAVSPDQTQIAYVNLGSLWLQPMGGTPEKLTTIEEDPARVSLVFSPDGKSLVYGNRGVSIMTLNTRASETLLTDVPFEETNDPGQIWDYSPARFLNQDRLLIDIGQWESQTAAIYDLPSHTLLQTEDLYNGLSIIPLTDGRYLYTSNTRIGVGFDAFLIGTPSTDPQTPFELTPFLVDEFAANRLTSVGIFDVVEIKPGMLRFIGMGLSDETQSFVTFLGEYNFNTDTLMLDTSEATGAVLFSTVALDMFSPDGHSIAGYANATYEGANLRGQIAIADLETMSVTHLQTAFSAIHFRWAGE